MLGPCSVFVKARKSRASVAPTNANAPNADPLKKVAKLVQNIVEFDTQPQKRGHRLEQRYW